MIDVSLVQAEILAITVVVVSVGVGSLSVYWLIRGIQLLREQIGDEKAQKRFDAAYQSFNGSYEEFESKWERGEI